jgi:hypothetical protein
MHTPPIPKTWLRCSALLLGTLWEKGKNAFLVNADRHRP